VSATVDANVLLYASDTSSPFNHAARELLGGIAESGELLYLFWPTAMGYLRLATHPAIFDHPFSPNEALANIEALLSLPTVRTAAEDAGFWRLFRSVASGLVVRGNLVPDAHLVALMRQHGVSTIWTHDRDFLKFSGIRVRDPFESLADR
jgi:toxin-antitoxin system PIN domain toxin